MTRQNKVRIIKLLAIACGWGGIALIGLTTSWWAAAGVFIFGLGQQLHKIANGE